MIRQLGQTLFGSGLISLTVVAVTDAWAAAWWAPAAMLLGGAACAAFDAWSEAKRDDLRFAEFLERGRADLSSRLAGLRSVSREEKPS